MAALSFYSNNWPSFSAIDDPELQSLLLNPDDYLFCNSLLDVDDPNSLPTATQPPFFHHQEYSDEPFFHFPKRQKLFGSQQLYPSLFDPCLSMLQDYSSPEFLMPPPPPPLLPEFPTADFSMGSSCEGVKSEGSLSAQSIAARQRRRRITVKTQELGKLVPGGQKMNTAEVLQSAHKYIRFLQAEVALLECLKEVNEAPFEGEEDFQNLLESPLIQEKLYSTDHCLVPHKLVKQLGFDDQIVKSNPHLLEKDH